MLEGPWGRECSRCSCVASRGEKRLTYAPVCPGDGITVNMLATFVIPTLQQRNVLDTIFLTRGDVCKYARVAESRVAQCSGMLW